MYVCFLPLLLFGLWMEGNDVEFRSLRGLRHKLVKLKHHVEVYNWCLSENITPKGLHLRKKACLGKVSKNFERKWSSILKEAERKLLLCLKFEALRMQERVSRDFHAKSKELTRKKGDKSVCDWLKILERFEKTWTEQVADRRRRKHRIEINRKATRVGTFEVCVSTHVLLRMFIMQVLASQLPFLANRNAELAVPPLFWPDTCIKNRGTCCTAEWPYCLYPILWRKFKSWSVKGSSRRRRALSPGAIRDLRTLVSSNELYNNGLRRNGEDSLNVNQAECMEVDRRILENEALEEVNIDEAQLRDEETDKFVSDNVVNISNKVLTQAEISLLSKGLKFCPTPKELDWYIQFQGGLVS